MDSNSFDNLARSFVAPVGRRRALGMLSAGGLFGLLGRGATPLPALAQQGTCVYDLVTTTRSGPSASQLLTADATAPGEVRGRLTFALDGTGALQNGSLVLSDGTTLPVVGQATGSSIQFRVAAGEGLVFVNVGVGAQPISACTGAVDGIVTGPQVGDLGDWHAVATGGGAQAPAAGGRVQIGGATGSTGAPGTAALPAGNSRPSGTTGTTGATGPAPGSSQCPPDQADCGNGCVSLGDERNCGACGNVCAAGDVCEDATCKIDCVAQSRSNCDNVCVDTGTDVNNCGICGNVCPADNICFAAQCEPITECQGSTTQCPTGCADLTLDPFNCGVCGTTCGANQTCVAGTCTDNAPPAPPANACPGNQQDCFGTCVDTSNNPNNCGACGVPCDTGVCQSSTCVAAGPACADGQVGCRGICVNTSNDPFNCGSCDFACGDGQTCVGGRCE